MDTTGEKIRAALKRSGRPYSAAVRRRAVDYARAQLDNGGNVTRVARELGISGVTLGSWMRGGVLAPVEIVPGPIEVLPAAERSMQSIAVIDSMTGLRVEGLDLDGVVALIARLR